MAFLQISSPDSSGVRRNVRIIIQRPNMFSMGTSQFINSLRKNSYHEKTKLDHEFFYSESDRTPIHIFIRTNE